MNVVGSTSVPPSRLGAVVIGYNERRNLARALESLREHVGAVVYVDSGSTDGSVEIARRCDHVDVISLGGSGPATPPAARNAGFAALRRRLPGLRYVHFLDGDCEMSPGWSSTAIRFLEANRDVAIVVGRVRERHRQRNAFHRLADLEWDQPVGDTASVGGNMAVRADAWTQVDGQNPCMPAGEEAEFCKRVLASGHRIVRVRDDMCLHDIDMGSMRQWLRRTMRTGHAFAQGYWASRDTWHGERTVSALGYAAVTVASVAAAGPTLGLSLAGLAVYPRLWHRMVRRRLARGDSLPDARLYASSIVLSKLPEAIGALRFFLLTLPRGRGGRRAPVPVVYPAPRRPADARDDAREAG